MDLIGQGIGTNPRRKTSFTGADGSQTTGIMNPLGLTQNNASMGYMGETAPPAQPQVAPISGDTSNQQAAAPNLDVGRPTPPSAPPTTFGGAGSSLNAAMATPNVDTGREQYIAQHRDLIATGMPGQQPTGGATDQAADPYSTGVQGSSIGRQIQGQQPQQMDAPLQPLAPQYGANGAPSWGGPRFMNGGRRRLPYAPPVSPVSQ